MNKAFFQERVLEAFIEKLDEGKITVAEASAAANDVLNTAAKFEEHIPNEEVAALSSRHGAMFGGMMNIINEEQLEADEASAEELRRIIGSVNNPFSN